VCAGSHGVRGRVKRVKGDKRARQMPCSVPFSPLSLFRPPLQFAARARDDPAAWPLTRMSLMGRSASSAGAHRAVVSAHRSASASLKRKRGAELEPPLVAFYSDRGNFARVLARECFASANGTKC
jgi:hypothetical protein